ncbi:hypothetical protein SLA2020_266470 [Shorea laevis]
MEQEVEETIGFEPSSSFVKVRRRFQTFLEARRGPEARKRQPTTSHLTGRHQPQSVETANSNFVLYAGLPTTAFKAHFLGFVFTLISTSPCHLHICLGVLLMQEA